MIRAIVVDDERLVRKGFIALFDWASFGIVIVGEAADGKAALELLEQTEVDLLFTDITMPRLSGFELISQVRQRYPRVRSVVLTCHHEFDYVQEALRQGAIDYIVKTLLEPESADEVMSRIVARLEWEIGSLGERLLGAEEEKLQSLDALLFYPRLREESSNELLRLTIVKRNPLLAVKQMWLVPIMHAMSRAEANRELAHSLSNRWQPVWIAGLCGQPLEEVKLVLAESVEDELFYKLRSADEPLELRYDDLQAVGARRLKGQGAGVLEASELLDLKWMLNARDWENFTGKIEQLRPSSGCVAAFGERLCAEWRGLLLKEIESLAMRSDIRRNQTWADWRLWLRRFSDHAQRRMMELGFSKEVMLCLIRAIVYMRQHSSGKLSQADVADYVKMSRSYFSQCFAKFAGEPFGVMIRRMRIERAKTLLLETDTPVYEIAFAIGFEDDKYFSKLFRELVGRLPSEYRADGALNGTRL
ncbi:response regulator transcription factor [Paenibacillus harenae]|uniref:response regulator transcription factor n=1 Tax=Paenibacillus harenae TaxID=306543 RepID=UPI00278EEE27|nr:response regulator [Paenibacillus harenae]MDQ0061410.1 two-component system response regulator YesN [Paenibacillus harenae]